jgi:transcriptional regulator with XRE-family HTH domain
MDKARTLAKPSPKRVGKQLRALRRKKGLSLSEVARGTGLSRRELVAYERGKVEIPDSDLWVLAGACGVDVSELVPPAEVPALVAAPSSIEDAITHLRSGQDDYVLNRHLNTLAALRALPPGSQVQLQDSERASMVETLGPDPGAIEQQLVDRMRVSREEAARLRELILPSAPRYSPLAVEAPPEPEAPPAADPWFGGAFEEETPTGPVDVFEELARLGEPRPGVHADAEVEDQSGAPLEAVLVETPAVASATAVVRAGDAPPIDVAARLEADAWRGTTWDPTASAMGGANATTGEPLTTRQPQPWEPPPSAWDAPWDTTTEPVTPVDDPVEAPTAPLGDADRGPTSLEIEEFVDDWVTPPADVAPFPWASTTADAGPDRYGPVDQPFLAPFEPADAPTDTEPPADLGPWGHEPDPAATSSGFYVDWGTGSAAPEPSGSPWDGLDTADGDVAPISWRPLTEPAPEPVGYPVATATYEVVDAVATIDVAPEPFVRTVPDPVPDPVPEPVEEFVTAGSEWILGNAVPLVEIRGQGGLVMRRADERWALADVTTTPDFVLEVEVDFRSGPGFGVLFHASADDGGHMSGYSFDVDPIHEGGSYLIRQWQADRELWNPLARVAAVDPASMHGVLTIRIVVVDDTVDASVNGERVLAVESLKQACADRNREPADGDRVGIQAWSSSDLVIDTLRVAER